MRPGRGPRRIPRDLLGVRVGTKHRRSHPDAAGPEPARGPRDPRPPVCTSPQQAPQCNQRQKGRLAVAPLTAESPTGPDAQPVSAAGTDFVRDFAELAVPGDWRALPENTESPRPQMSQAGPFHLTTPLQAGPVPGRLGDGQRTLLEGRGSSQQSSDRRDQGPWPPGA